MNPSGTAGRGMAAARSARAGYDRAIDLLERLVPIANRLEQVIRYYGLAVLVSAVVILVTLLAADVPGTVWTWGLLAFVGFALMAPPVLILVFAFMLREALRLPAQFRSIPDVAPARARELASLARSARDWRPREEVGSIPRDSWRAGRLLNALRKEIPGVSILLSIARVPFLILVGLAMLAGLVEIVLAPIVVVVAVLASVT